MCSEASSSVWGWRHRGPHEGHWPGSSAASPPEEHTQQPITTTTALKKKQFWAKSIRTSISECFKDYFCSLLGRDALTWYFAGLSCNQWWSEFLLYFCGLHPVSQFWPLTPDINKTPSIHTMLLAQYLSLQHLKPVVCVNPSRTAATKTTSSCTKSLRPICCRVIGWSAIRIYKKLDIFPHLTVCTLLEASHCNTAKPGLDRSHYEKWQ